MHPPIVLCLSGLDPGGGAGVQADIETLAAHQVHALSLITALTVQDSGNVVRVVPTDPALLAEQLECLLADCRPSVIKLGLIGGAGQLRVIIETIRRCAVPVVCDPVLRAGGGGALVDDGYAAVLRRELLPFATVLTPNAAEARRLAPEADDLGGAAQALLVTGCTHVLLTGGDEPDASVINTWYRAGALPRRFEWPRLPETFHGAGCTLASAIAARLALGDRVEQALQNAQVWTQASLDRAFAIGRGRRIPGRFSA